VGLILTLGDYLSAGSVIRVSEPEAKRWVRHVIPLPKQFTLTRTIRVAPSNIVVRLREGSGEVEAHAAARLAERFGVKVQTGPAQAGQFEILIGTADREGRVSGVKCRSARKMEGLPNADQAYVIEPDGKNRLVLAGRAGEGVFYAAVTLLQLLDTGSTNGPVAMPLVRVVDWPDLAERGQWGDLSSQMDWMSGYKLNVDEVHAQLRVTPDGRGTAQPYPHVIEEGRKNAFRVVQIINHLEQNAASGIYKHFPELRARDASGKQVFNSPCFAQPKARAILTDWMYDLAAHPDVNRVSVWLSEDAPMTGECQCDQCRPAGQYVMETRAILEAYRRARQLKPDLELRILLTQGTLREPANPNILALLPQEVGVSFYGATYTVAPHEMIPPLLTDWARSGHWLGVYPTLEPQYDVPCPWSAPQFVRYRMTEFADKRLRNFAAFVTPGGRTYEFNVAAAAEWSWNVGGRTEREFAAAWATRRGYKDPDAVADWAVTLASASWDFYGYESLPGGGLGFEQMFDSMVALLRSRSQPVLGKGLFTGFASEEQLRRDEAACEKALDLALAEGAAELISETRVISGWIALMRELYEMAGLLSAATPPDDAERQHLREHHRVFCRTAFDIIANLDTWQRASGCGDGVALLSLKPTLEKLVNDVSDTLRPWGLANPYAAYTRRDIGSWEDKDFDGTGKAHIRWNVTDFLDGPATYEVQFVYGGGPWGLTITRAALAAEAGDSPDELEEISVDEHAGVAALWSRGDTYRLNLDHATSNAAYYVVADISAPVPPPDQIGVNCRGTVRFRKVPPPSGLPPEAPLDPMAPEEIEWYQPPSFTNGGLRVGIIRGGPETDGLYRFLCGRPDIDAQLLSGNPAHFKLCRVIVYPGVHSGPFSQRVLPGYYWHHYPSVTAEFVRFVREGGGFVAMPGVTSDPGSVGFVGAPLALFPEICRGVANTIKGSQWMIAGDHALTHGLRPNQYLPVQWREQFVLEPGPHGTVVVRANSGGFRPATVIGGAAGKGRYVACGLYLGIDGAARDALPNAEEGRLLENAIHWAGGD